MWGCGQAVMRLAQPKHLDAACVAAQSANDNSVDDATWRCLFGQYRMPFVKTPYLLVASQVCFYNTTTF
jgi:hypothetical protein